MTGSRIVRGLLALALLSAPVARADEPVYAAPEALSAPVVSVEVQGQRRIEEATVLASIGMRRGDTATASRIRRDIESIMDSGFFDDVRVETFPAEGGVRLVYFVKEKPAIRDVRITGNKKVEEEDIREVIDIRSFAVLSDAEVAQNVDQIRDLYVEKGYYLVEIEPEVVRFSDDQVELVFHIQENRKVVVQSVEFTGNENVPSSKIKRFMQVKEGGIAPWLTGTGSFREENLDADLQTIRSVFLEEGYLDAEVDPPKVYLSPDKRSIYVSFHVTEGEKYAIGAIEVDGDFVEAEGLTRDAVLEIVGGRPVVEVQEDQWRAAHGKKKAPMTFEGRGPVLETGDDFKLSTLQMVMSAVQDFYSDQGYAHATVVPETNTDPLARTVDLKLVVDKGEKYRIGRIQILGNDPTFDKVVRRELVIDEGDVFRGSRIKASRARLERLGYFDDISISTPRGAGPGVMDMNIQVSEQPTGSFSLGLGFSNLEQFVLTANVSKNNFLGLGYIMSAAINWSALRRQGNLSFFDPYFLDSRWTLRVDGYSLTREYQLNEYQRGGTLEIGRYLDARDDVRVALEYTFEDVGLTSLDAFRLRMLGGDLYRNGLTSSLGLSFNIDKRNNRINATKGFYASASAQLSGGFGIGDDKVLSLLGGEFNFVEARANLRFFQPLLRDSDFLVFRFNSSLGWIHSTDGRVIPFIHRFRAGGINSVRGFNWFSLGPTIRGLPWNGTGADDPVRGEDELIIGGTETWVNNFEIESPIIKQAGISAVVFFDAGNAFGDPWGGGHISLLDLRTSVGAGIRWRSPMGPLRFELGYPLRPQEGERRSVFDFSIGSFF